MGKGDKKTPKGKRYAGSYGNARPHKATTKAPVVAATKAPVAKKTTAVRKKAS